MNTQSRKKQSPATATPQASTTAPSPPVSSTATPTPPDPNAALALFAQQCVAQLDTMQAGLGGDPPLTPTQKRHASKLRKGGAAFATQVGNLATQQQLESPALQVSPMLASIARAEALQALAARATAFAKQVGDIIFQSESDAFVVAQQFYALLQKRAAFDATLAASLAPVQGFFARRSKGRAAQGGLTKAQVRAGKKAQKALAKNAAEQQKLPANEPAPAAASATPSPVPPPGTNGGHA